MHNYLIAENGEVRGRVWNRPITRYIDGAEWREFAQRLSATRPLDVHSFGDASVSEGMVYVVVVRQDAECVMYCAYAPPLLPDEVAARPRLAAAYQWELDVVRSILSFANGGRDAWPLIPYEVNRVNPR
jgi:hypothetical protein